MPATIHTIVNTGAMLKVGQERSNEKNRALAAKPCCASDSNCATPLNNH
jgi:hypothetical protein